MTKSDYNQTAMADAFQTKTHLHFGAVVYLSCFQGAANFYMFSNGISFKSVLSLTDMEGPIDPAQCLFTITPPMKFQAETFLERVVQNRYLEDLEMGEIDQKKAKVHIDQFEFELKQNNKMKEQQLKFPIKYGQNFMLQHKFSSKYLSYSKDAETNEYTLNLSEIPTSACAFNLDACYNYQKDINTYIPFNSAAFLNVKIHEMLKIKEMNLNFSPNSLFDPWVFAEEGCAKIQFGLYQPCQEIQYKSVCFGDSVWIFHLESGSFVKILNNNKINDTIILKKIRYVLGFMKDEREIKQDAEPAKIIIQKVQNQMSAEKSGLWKIIPASNRDNQQRLNVNPQRFIGGKIKFDQEIRFFNVRYNSYLSVRKIKKSRNKFEFQLNMEETEEENTIFKIKSLSSSSPYVTTEDLFLVQNVLTETYLTLSQPLPINQTKAPLAPSLSYKKEDNLKFTKIDFLQQWQNNYILSILPFLNDGIESLQLSREGRVTQKDQVILKLMSENLLELLTFSYDLTEGFQASESKLGKMTYNHFMIQKLLREQGVVNKIIQILRCVKIQLLIKEMTQEKQEPTKMQDMLKIVKKFSVGIKVGDHGQYPLEMKLIRKIINSSFKILRNCCKSNSENCQYLFTKIPVFVQFLGLETYAEDFFMDSFHNQAILLRIGTEELKAIIQQYIHIYERTGKRSEKLFLLLEKLISFENMGISTNQLEVFRLFFYLGNPLMIPIEHSDRFFTVQGLQLTQYCNEHPQYASYLAKQIKFYAHLTQDRNYVCSKTIKKMFPLSTVFSYFLKKAETPIEEELKVSFLCIIINSYLNERPRFVESHPFIFSMSGQMQETMNQAQMPHFETEIQLMRQQGLTQDSIDDIISCIHQDDTMNREQLSQLKDIVIKEIQKIAGAEANHFYTYKTESFLLCLKYLIELSVFKREETKKVEQLIENIAEQIAKSLALANQNTVKLESPNFRQLLLQMVEKNVIKKFNYSVKYDGVEDQVNFDNVCSIFVNYSFYQNILLEQKDPKKRKQADSATKIMLELIRIYSNMILLDKFSVFHEQIVSKYHIQRYKQSKSQFVEDIIVNRILNGKPQDKSKILSLLALLFYNSNTYVVNYFTLSIILGQIFAERTVSRKLSTVIFTVDEQESENYNLIVTEFKNIKLLIQTCQIWLNVHEIRKQTTSKYDPVLLLFISKMKKLTKAIMPDLDENMPQGTLAGIWTASTIQPETQQIVSNLNIEKQIIKFIFSYKQLINQIKVQKIKIYNKNIVPIFRSCFLFLFAFCYNCPENKAKIHQIIKENFLRTYFDDVGTVEFGESMLIIQFLKNNYEECIDFFNRNTETLQKKYKYTLMHSQLLLTMMKFYDEPILANIRKLYISIFDFSSYKNFIWLKADKNQLNLQVGLFGQEQGYQPFVYHINAFQMLIQIITHVQESRNTIKSHIRKSLSQEYLYQLLNIDDYYTKDNSNKPILKLVILLKQKIMKLLSFVYFSEDTRSDTLIFNELKRQNEFLNKLIQEAPARKENQNFKRIIIMKEESQHSYQDKKIQELFKSLLAYNWGGEHLLEIKLNSIFNFCSAYMKVVSGSQDHQLRRIGEGCQQIQGKIQNIYDILYKMKRNEGDLNNNFPVPSQWLFSIPAAGRDEESIDKKRYTASILIQSMFNKKIFAKFEENECQVIQHFFKILETINLKQLLFLRKLSEFVEDAFEKLSNGGNQEMMECIKMLIKFLTLWIRSSPKDKVNEIRGQIGKSELIFPILNYFETCQFNKFNKELFLLCLQFYNELLGEQGNPSIQTIFNQYFTNKADSLEFFMKVKQLFDEINFQDRANYQCKKIYEGMEAYGRDSRLQKGPEFILLNFLICLCKGSFRDNQIFLSSLSNISNFNIMSGIWEILKYQAQKYKKNLINVQNYHLITQCFSTIKELVEGPCAQNQNEFLKRDFFLTVLDYFQFQSTESDLTLQGVIQDKLTEFHRISPSFTDQLKIYLNQDKITMPWMPSQVKYRCINLICSLMAENVTAESKNQLYTLPVSLIIKELDRVYQRFQELGLQYSYENLQVKNQKEVVLPLGLKLYELLQYYPPDKIPEHSVGLDFFRLKSRVVEVVHQKLCFVVFPHVPEQISEGFMKQFLEEVDRTSVNSKLRGLQDAQIQNRQSDYPYGYFIFILVIALTVMDIVIYNSISLSKVQYFNFYPILMGYGNMNTLELVVGIIDLAIVILAILFLSLQVRGAIYFKEFLGRLWNEKMPRWTKIKQFFSFIWENLSYFYYAFAIILSVLSMFNPFFDAILLLAELNRRSQTFAATINAISSTLDQLLVVLLLTLTATYVLTGIFYYERAGEDFPAECSTLYYCFVFSLDNGYRADAGIVGYTDDEDTILSAYQPSTSFNNVLLNFIYLLIIKVIIDQLIGAIIVDKFVALREGKQKIQQDEESFCFICGLDRNLLDREEDGFERHKAEYHNIWNYFEFLMYLRKSKIHNFSGIQRFVYQEQKQGKLNWYPINRSLHLELKNQENTEVKIEDNEIEKVSKNLDGEISTLNTEMGQIWDYLNLHFAREAKNDSY